MILIKRWFSTLPILLQQKHKKQKKHKNSKIFSKLQKKKKRFYAIIHPMHVQCIKIQTHFKKENVYEKNPFTLSLSLVFAPR